MDPNEDRMFRKPRVQYGVPTLLIGIVPTCHRRVAVHHTNRLISTCMYGVGYVPMLSPILHGWIEQCVHRALPERGRFDLGVSQSVSLLSKTGLVCKTSFCHLFFCQSLLVCIGGRARADQTRQFSTRSPHPSGSLFGSIGSCNRDEVLPQLTLCVICVTL